MNKFQKLVEKSGKTYHQISVESGINHATIYRLKNGITEDILLSRAFALAEALSVDVNELKGAFGKEK